jgi:TonB family protein
VASDVFAVTNLDFKFGPSPFAGCRLACVFPLVLVLFGGCESAPGGAPRHAQTQSVTRLEAGDLAGVSRPPIPRFRAPPAYPWALREAKVSGYAVVDFVVTTTGDVANARVMSTNDDRFAEAALAAVNKWKFRPAIENGMPVSHHLRVPIQFRPEDPDVPAPAPRTEPQRVTGQIYDFSKVETPPQPRMRVPPRYPRELREVGMQGEVKVDFVITTEGLVANATAVESTDRGFEADAVEAVSRWRFFPAKIDGVPVNCRTRMPIIFRLGN